MRNIYLVDTENVNEKALSGFSKDNGDLVILFVTNRTDKGCFSRERVKKAIGENSNIKRINVLTGGKNSLDFQLVSYLGLLVGSSLEKDANYYIVSKDKGFNSSINLLTNCTDVNIDLIPSITEEEQTDDTEEYIEAVKSRGFTRKTAIKALKIINESTTRKQAVTMLHLQFGGNPNVVNTMVSLMDKYLRDVC